MGDHSMSEPTEYHCVMTIQSFWNGQPSAAITHTTYQRAESAAELYGIVHARTMEAWRKQNPQISMGTPVVMHWSFTPIPEPAAEPTAAEPTAASVVADGQEVSSADLAAWLMDNGYADERPGYGHADGLTLADALRGQFDITVKA